MANERANQSDIAHALGLHPSTVNWHAKRLIAALVIAKTREGKDIHYSLNRELDLARVIAVIEGDNIELADSGSIVEGASS
jgi:predicted transcriptional regulator